MHAYSLSLVLDLPVQHVIRRPLRAANDHEAVRVAYGEWCAAPLWECRSRVELRGENGEVIWRQEQPAPR